MWRSLSPLCLLFVQPDAARVRGSRDLDGHCHYTDHVQKCRCAGRLGVQYFQWRLLGRSTVTKMHGDKRRQLEFHSGASAAEQSTAASTSTGILSAIFKFSKKMCK